MIEHPRERQTAGTEPVTSEQLNQARLRSPLVNGIVDIANTRLLASSERGDFPAWTQMILDGRETCYAVGERFEDSGFNVRYFTLRAAPMHGGYPIGYVVRIAQPTPRPQS